MSNSETLSSGISFSLEDDEIVATHEGKADHRAISSLLQRFIESDGKFKDYKVTEFEHDSLFVVGIPVRVSEMGLYHCPRCTFTATSEAEYRSHNRWTHFMVAMDDPPE